MTTNVAETGLAVLGNVLNTIKTVRGADSLVAATQAARVEPIVLMDSDCLYADLTPNVMQTLLSVFTAYYLQAWDLCTNVGNVQVLKTLEKLNPARDMINNIPALESLLDMDDQLPVFNQPRPVVTVSFEDAADANATAVKEQSNLSVGKLLQVEIKTDVDVGGGQTKVKVIKIPVSVRLMVHSIASANLVQVLNAGNKDVSLSERKHQLKTGEISFLRDFIFCEDLIKEHKRNLMMDKSGVLDAIQARKTSNMVSSLLSGNLSVATASNIVVMSEATASRLEVEAGGPLSDFKMREKIFNKCYLMIIAVIYPEFDRVVFYTRGIPTTSSASARDLKGNASKSGPDVADILAAYKVGTSPSLS